MGTIRTIGILGAGQLGRMMATEAQRLGLPVLFFDPADEAPGESVAPRFKAQWHDRDALDRFASRISVATFEFENLPVSTALQITRRVPLRPSVEALSILQDRLLEKRLLNDLAIETAPFAPVDGIEDLETAARLVGFPAILKLRRGGYDGRGQWPVSDFDSLAIAVDACQGRPAILEQRIEFDREVSIVAVRDIRGNMEFYPVVENHHQDGILRRTIAPAPGLPRALASQARASVRALAERLDYVGVLTIEFFLCGDRLLANETAPRVHNSGHFTLDACETSQFENHLRAIAGLPLGSAALKHAAVMVNLIGEVPPLETVLARPGARLHLYGKTARMGRKLGHVTWAAASPDTDSLQ